MLPDASEFEKSACVISIDVGGAEALLDVVIFEVLERLHNVLR